MLICSRLGMLIFLLVGSKFNVRDVELIVEWIEVGDADFLIGWGC